MNMKTPLLLLLSIPFLLSACAGKDIDPTVPNVDTYLDFSKDKTPDRVNNYWVFSKRVNSKYPETAAKNHLAGCVQVITLIDSDGKPAGMSIGQSFPEGIFDKAALKAVSDWRWTKTSHNKQAVPVMASYYLDYQVSNASNEKQAADECDFTG